MAAAQDQRSYTTLAVIDGDARGMRSSDYAVVLRAVDRLRIAGLVSPPDGVYVAPRVHASAVRNASGSCWSWGFAGADGASAPTPASLGCGGPRGLPTGPRTTGTGTRRRVGRTTAPGLEGGRCVRQQRPATGAEKYPRRLR